jgi:hypothetical protein
MMKKDQKKVKLIYLTPKQAEFLNARQKRKALVAGRGFGKTHVAGHHLYRLFRNLPTGKSLLVSTTYYQLLTKTCPEVESSWKDYGIQEYDPKKKTGHWVFGKKPPEHFVKPYKQPKNPEYCYFFINGHVIELGSLEVKDRFRGGSFDALVGDESALFKEDVWNKIFVTSVRGRTVGPGAFDPKINFMHQSITHFTSAPWLVEGQWVFKYRELAKQYPDDYFFMSGKTTDNIAILGEDYINNLKNTLSPLEYYVEVLNGEMKRQIGGGYYPAFSEEKHTTDFTFQYDWDKGGKMTVRRDSFIQENQPLLLSMDFNIRFTCMIVCQQYQQPTYQEFRILDNMFSKPDPLHDKDGELLIDSLVDSFCKKYANHPVKYVELYGDASGNNRRLGAPPLFEQAAARFKFHGWQPIIKAGNKLPMHEFRHVLINNILRRSEPKFPIVTLNNNNCKALVMSIMNAPIKEDYSKDKKSEMQNIAQEFATHLSDCFDYILVSLYGKLVMTGNDSIWSSIMSRR